MGGGQVEPTDIKFDEKCLCSDHNIIALIKQTSLFDTANIHEKYQISKGLVKRKIPISRTKQRHDSIHYD